MKFKTGDIIVTSDRIPTRKNMVCLILKADESRTIQYLAEVLETGSAVQPDYSTVGHKFEFTEGSAMENHSEVIDSTPICESKEDLPDAFQSLF